jgi:hypothetical protein
LIRSKKEEPTTKKSGGEFEDLKKRKGADMREEECNCVRCGYCCTEMEIKPSHLIFPSLLPTPEAKEFYRVHGLDSVIANDEMIRILHRCQHLNEKNDCGLERFKPKFCADWVCRREFRDPEWFKEMLGEMALARMERLAEICSNIDGVVNVGKLTKEVMSEISLYMQERDRLLEVLPNAK